MIRFPITAIALVMALAAQVAAGPAPPSELEAVLDRMDAAAASFRTAEADFVWDQYQRVVQETDTQKGKVFFRRRGQETQMAAEIAVPDKKYVLFTEGKVRLYQPRIDQVTEYSTGKNKGEVESFLVLGFGGRGHDLLKSFEVRYAGSEAIGGVKTARLELQPKTLKMRGVFERIVLWIDWERGVSLQQQFFEPSGDYRLAQYTNIRLNQQVADDVFRLKTTSKTKFVNPQG
ncbi:MAG TPA: outer-membrane lipoprotein carrier protein LolA [Terriglobales bacterium]|nr:outer-membrane lipoprotein carrier protein LolA [Terriglobales bacterium]